MRADFLLFERIGNLEVVEAGGADKAQLIAGRCVEDEGSEKSGVVAFVVKFVRFWRHEADVCTSAAYTGVPGETFGVIAKAELGVSCMITAVSCDEFGFAVAFKAGTRNHVECRVSPITVFGGEAAALYLNDVYILGIELSTYI